MISLASKRKPNIENELSSFTGDLNTLSDFLIEEILSGLSENMKELLFSTALLNSFCLKLVKACFEPKKDDNSDLLRTETLFDLLINSNFFLIPLDNERKWFRYHHLFQKTLVKHLGSGFDAESIKRVHYLAAKWFEDEGLIEEALDHMVKSGKVEEAARIIEINAHNEFLKNVGIVEIWLNKLPLVVKESSPGLQMINAWLAFGEFHLEKIPPILEKVNKLIQDTIPDPQLSSELSFMRLHVHCCISISNVTAQHSPSHQPLPSPSPTATLWPISTSTSTTQTRVRSPAASPTRCWPGWISWWPRFTPGCVRIGIP